MYFFVFQPTVYNVVPPVLLLLQDPNAEIVKMNKMFYPKPWLEATGFFETLQVIRWTLRSSGAMYLAQLGCPYYLSQENYMFSLESAQCVSQVEWNVGFFFLSYFFAEPILRAVQREMHN